MGTATHLNVNVLAIEASAVKNPVQIMTHTDTMVKGTTTAHILAWRAAKQHHF
jgi:hypothetical protein